MPANGDAHAMTRNLTRDAEEPGEAEVAGGHTGSSFGIPGPGDDWREAFAADQIFTESREVGALATALSDIGAASFRASDVVFETVYGADGRIQVENTTSYAYRANASLLITARDGSQWVGTGLFISPRTLVTAGHCIFGRSSTMARRDGWVESIQIMPSHNGSEWAFGSATSTQFWTVRW